MTVGGIVSAFYGVGLVKKLSSASLIRLISVLLFGLGWAFTAIAVAEKFSRGLRESLGARLRTLV